MRLYLAAPLFTEAERAFNLVLVQARRRLTLVVPDGDPSRLLGLL